MRLRREKTNYSKENEVKIFCIGLSKTATSSLSEAISILGLKSVHWGHTRHMLKYTDTGIQIYFEEFDKYDAFSDTPIARIYKELDKKYPGSKFILTVRDNEKWAKSFSDQFKKGGLDSFSEKLHLDLYGTASFDHDKCIKAFNDHTNDVLDYFNGRDDDLLIIDITAGEGWDKLCSFLSLPTPDIKFPINFTKGERKLTFGYRLKRFLHNPSLIPGKVMLRLNKLFSTGRARS